MRPCTSARCDEYCPGGGAVAMWRSPALRGPAADWRRLPHLLFANNRSIFPGEPMPQQDLREFVTIDYIGALPGDGGGEHRVVRTTSQRGHAVIANRLKARF